MCKIACRPVWTTQQTGFKCAHLRKVVKSSGLYRGGLHSFVILLAERAKRSMKVRKYTLSPISTLLEWSGRLIGWDFQRIFQCTDIHEHSMITFLSPSASLFPPIPLFSICQAKRTDNFVHFCGFSETPNQTLKQMISWCNGPERCNQQQNKLCCTGRAITKRLHPGKHFKYLQILVKQSGIILCCYNTEKKLSYFPYFRLIPRGWKQEGGSD